jgi:radical SAM protein with 4Fe4S-binding SPASM domain
MCYWGDSDFQAGMKSEDFDGGPMKRTMPTELAIRLIDEAWELGVPSMKFHGRGDGIHHKHYNAILQHARYKGGWELLVNTHGNAAWDKIDGLMVADKVMISLDSARQPTYAKMRVGGRLGAAIWTVEELLRRGHKNIWVRRVITDINREENFVEECREIFGDAVHVSEHFAFNRRNSKRNSATHYEDESSWEREYCTYPSVRLMCLSNGRVVPCCVDWKAEMVVGDVNTQSLKEIWNGEKITALRSELRSGEFKSAICAACTSFSAFRRPEKKFVKDVEGTAKL